VSTAAPVCKEAWQAKKRTTAWCLSCEPLHGGRMALGPMQRHACIIYTGWAWVNRECWRISMIRHASCHSLLRYKGFSQGADPLKRVGRSHCRFLNKHSGEHSHHEQEFSLSEVTTAAYIHNRQIHHVRLSNALEASLVAIGKGAFRQSI
jgi:hypothetical protein